MEFHGIPWIPWHNSTVATVLLQQYCCNSTVATILLRPLGGNPSAAAAPRRRPLGGGGPSAAASRHIKEQKQASPQHKTCTKGNHKNGFGQESKIYFCYQ